MYCGHSSKSIQLMPSAFIALSIFYYDMLLWKHPKIWTFRLVPVFLPVHTVQWFVLNLLYFLTYILFYYCQKSFCWAITYVHFLILIKIVRVFSKRVRYLTSYKNIWKCPFPNILISPWCSKPPFIFANLKSKEFSFNICFDFHVC